MYEETYSQPGIGVTVVSPGRPILVGRPLEVLFNLYPFFSLALSGAAALPVRHGQKTGNFSSSLSSPIAEMLVSFSRKTFVRMMLISSAVFEDTLCVRRIIVKVGC